MLSKNEIVDTLNDLIQITEDSHLGYKQAAEDAGDADLKSLFNDLSSQRGAMVRDLQLHVAEQGAAPESSGTTLGSAHRFFMNLKSAVTGRDREAIINEVERGETEAVRRFENALQKDLPTNISQAVRGHLERLRSDRNRMSVIKAA